MTRRARRWGISLALLVVLAALRLPWRDADAGNSGLWAYGYFTTDEGHYTSGGRLGYLTGNFLDFELSDPPSFRVSYGMHWLSYFGYRLAGLTVGATRWPTMLLAIAGWLAAYVAASRVTSPWVAGIVVLLVSCNPVSLTYERTASTDVVVGALSVLAYALIGARRSWPTWVAGLLVVFAFSVKPTAALFLPLLLLAMLARKRWRRLAIFALACVVTLAALLAIRNLCIRASAHGWTEASVRAELMRASFSASWIGGSLRQVFLTLSAFPRWPASEQMGPLVIWMIAIPAWCAALAWSRRDALLRPRTAGACGLLTVVGAVAIGSYAPVRYLLPVVFWLPLLVVSVRGVARRGRVAPILAAAAAAAVLYWLPAPSLEKNPSVYALNEFTPPSETIWRVSGLRMAFGAAAMTAAIAYMLGRWKHWGNWMIAAALGISFVWVFFANFTVTHLDHSPALVRDQVLLQIGVAVACAVTLAARRWQIWYLAQALVFGAFVLFHSQWHRAYAELGTRTFLVRDAACEISQRLPPDAIVIGRRASTLLRSTPFRLGLCTPNYRPTEFVERVQQLLERHPDQPLYWLVESDGSFQWEFYREHGRDKWNVTHVATLAIPSGDQLQLRETSESGLPLARVYLMRVTAR